MNQSNPWGNNGKSSSPFGKGFPFGFGQKGEEADDYEVPFAKDEEPDSEKGKRVRVPGKWVRLGKKMLIIAIVVAIVVLLFLYWWFHPPINIHSSDLWVFITIFILLPLFLVFRHYRKVYEEGTDKRQPSAAKAKTFKMLSRIPVIILLIGIIGGLASATFFPFNANKYAHILETQEISFASDIKEVDYNSIPVIDYSSAVLLGNRAMGTMADYVSQFEISGMYSQINYQGRPVRVSPLNYANIIKWITNMRTGIPAYAIVDMPSQNTKIVRLEKPIKYSESDPLFKNVDRYVQLKFPFYMFDQKSFEIDEQGVPYWVCPVQKRSIGLFGGTTISRVVLCNASTGECQDYAIEDVPSWVDRAYPTDLLIQQYNWSGRYINGWWNSWLGQEGVKQTTPGTDGTLGYNYIAKDDDVWVYTGVTSATGDDSIIGFVLINQRTAESHFYPVSGATEDSAMYSAEGQVQHLRYTATFPLLLNINGQPTYFMALKDSAGLVKKYAMIDIQRYQNVAIGDTVSDCQKSYKTLLATNGLVSSGDDESGMQEAKGVIRTMTQAVIDGNTHFYLTLEDDDNIYDCPISVIEIVAYNVGDKITFQYYPGTPTCTVMGVGKMTEEEIAARQQELEAQQAAAGQESSDGVLVEQGAA